MTTATSKKGTFLKESSNIYNNFDWKKISYFVFLSRALDDIEEKKLVPQKKVFNQFSARGHDVAQVLLSSRLNDIHDGASGYYRSRPFILTTGLSLLDAVSSPMAKSGGYSDGRDIGVVCNNPGQQGTCVFPMQGGVGAQYTPVTGWAQAILYRKNQLKDSSYNKSIAVVLGGDASMCTGGFWSALNIATTLKLPQLFFIEDNGYGISVPSSYQTPGGDFVENLNSYKNLKILDGKGYEIEEAAKLIDEAVAYTRSHKGPCLLRLKVPRLCGHTFQDTQTYKSKEFIEFEQKNDPLPNLKNYLVPKYMSKKDWQDMEQKAYTDIDSVINEADKLPEPDPKYLQKYVFSETDKNGSEEIQSRGGLWGEKHQFPNSSKKPNPEGGRINMITAIRMTLDHELKTNPKVLVFGEDVGVKGGVHGATLGLQEKYGISRVFDTSLNEEGIIGRSVGMAYAGLMPVAEIQFRKYSEPSTEQLTDCGTVRWRTNNRFAAPIIVRMPGGYAKRGDPWHGMCNEVEFAHGVGWQVAYPSNSEDAVGLLRQALRCNNPTIFFEHRALYDYPAARKPYPGDDYVLPFGKANKLTEGDNLTIITWGALVQPCIEVANDIPGVEVLDLRTIFPWDKEATLSSVQKTGRCLIVHEDTKTAGFGAEIGSYLAKEAFYSLDAPIERLTMPDIPCPHNIHLLNEAIPSVEKIKKTVEQMISE